MLNSLQLANPTCMPRQFKPAIPAELIEQKIYLIRGQKVMLAEHSASTPTNPAIRVIDIPESYVRRFASGRVMLGKAYPGTRGSGAAGWRQVDYRRSI